MPSVYDLKPRFQNLLRPLVQKLTSRGVTANQVTVSAAVFSCFISVLVFEIGPLARPVYFLLPISLLLRMALNAIDGMLAREHQMKSALGAILNEVGDVVSDMFLFFSLSSVLAPVSFLLLSAAFLSFLTEFVGVLGPSLGDPRRYEGPMGKSDRAVVLGVVGLFVGLGVTSTTIFGVILGAVNLLLLRTIWNRANKALKRVDP